MNRGKSLYRFYLDDNFISDNQVCTKAYIHSNRFVNYWKSLLPGDFYSTFFKLMGKGCFVNRFQ